MRLLVLALALLAAAAVPASSQDAGTRAASGSPSSLDQHRPPDRFGLGVQVGDPSGISLKLYQANAGRRGLLRTPDAYTFLIAWDLDRFFYVNAHALRERPIEDSPLNYYIGPGVIGGVRESAGNDADFVVGVSGDFGLNFFADRFEVFLGLSPWFRIIPDPDLNIGGGVGLRYYP